MKKTTLKLLNDAVLETLEDRRMMSATPGIGAALNSGVVSVTGSPSAPTFLQINPCANKTELQVNLNGNFWYFPAKQVDEFKVSIGNGNTYAYIDPGIDIPANVQAGNGNDQIRTGAGNDTIVAGNGNDIIYGKTGNNEIEVGSGRDTLQGSTGNDTLVAGNGNDSIVSGGGSDNITSGNGNSTILAGWGHDHVTVGTGKDAIIGGSGNTVVYSKSSGSISATGSKTTTSNTGVSTSSSPTAAPTSQPGGAASTSGSSSTASGTTSSSSSSTSAGSSTSSGSTTSSSGSSSSGSTTATPATVTSGPVITLPSVDVGHGQAPVAVINMLAGPRETSMVVNVDALSSTVGTGTCITSNYAWDFGDAGTAYNTLTGFNAAHVYDTPGNYTITLTVTNEAGLVSTTTQQVSVTASTRKAIYVDSVKGSDSNAGSQNAPLQSLAAAFSKLGDNTEILLNAGDTFYTASPLSTHFTNVLIGRYGTGASPEVMRTMCPDQLPTIETYGNTDGLTIQDITFNTPYAVADNGAAAKIGIGGIFLGGQNIAIRNCTFLNIDDAINENGLPTGVLIQGNSAPLITGIRSYLVWGQGQQTTVLGNYAANSTREHICRMHAVVELNMQGNNFTNLSRQGVDSYDTSKGCIELQTGMYDWIVGNTVTDGDIRVGPLGLWGEAASTNNTDVVIEDNNLTDTFIFVQSATHDAMISNNVINNATGSAIQVNGVDDQGRTSMDITIVHNTGIDTGTQGNFIQVWGYVNGIVMNNNLWVAPNVQIGAYGSAPVYVATGYMSDFTQISGNIWPLPTTSSAYVNGGVNFVGTSALGNGLMTPAQWNAQNNVGNDTFQNVTLNGSYEVSYDSLLAGAALQMAA